MSANWLNTTVYTLLLSHGFFRFGRAAFDIFLSVFIWKITGDIQTVAIFNIIYALTHTAMFVVWSPFVGRGWLNTIKKIGLVGFCCIYVALAPLGESMSNHVFFLAFLIGIVNGSYWFSYQIQRFDVTHIKNRGNYTGIESATKIFVGLVAPIIGGLLITLGGGESGYKWLFGSAAMLFVLSILFSTGGQESEKKPLLGVDILKDIAKTPKVMRVFLSGTMSGFALGNGALSSALIPLLIFEKTGNELSLGGWLSAFALASIITSLVVGKVVNYTKYDVVLLLGRTVLIGSFVLLLAFPSFWSVVVFGVVQQMAASMMEVPRRVYSENLLHTIPNYEEYKVVYLVIREVFNIGIGMVGSFVVLFLFAGVDASSLYCLSGLVVLATMFQVWLLTSIKYASQELQE